MYGRLMDKGYSQNLKNISSDWNGLRKYKSLLALTKLTVISSFCLIQHIDLNMKYTWQNHIFCIYWNCNWFLCIRLALITRCLWLYVYRKQLCLHSRFRYFFRQSRKEEKGLVTITALGYVIDDPQLKRSQKGRTYSSFVLAVQQGYGETAHTMYLQCWAFDIQAELLSRMRIRKGSCLQISGDLDDVESFISGNRYCRRPECRKDQLQNRLENMRSSWRN